MTFAFRIRFVAMALALASAGPVARAYSTFGRAWAAGNITMQLQLGAPSSPLSDGASTWDAVAESALAEWNGLISRSQFVAIRGSTAAKAQGNRLNNVFFAPDVYGEGFGSGVLAITLSFRNSRNTTECDVVFNSARAWESYRGPLRRSTTDFRRVALHEFGHVLGLDHPDEATPPQTVDAVMNSRVSNTEAPTADDIAGVQSLYPSAAAASGAPTIIAQPTSQTVQVTGSYTMNVGASGTGALAYAWRFRAASSTTSEPFLLATGPSYTIGSVQAADAGTYTVTVSNGLGTSTSTAAALTVTPLSTNSGTMLANISTRGVVGTDASVLIAGLVIRGTTPKNVVVRAVGPTLADFGVAGVLADPELKIIDGSGQVVAQNDNWESGGAATLMATTFARLGAFQFAPGSGDAAVSVTLPPGNYTAVVSGANGTTGIALVEAYDADADATASATRRLVNIATRGQIGTGEDVLIAGLVVRGPGPHTYLIRAVGPTLGSLGVPGAIDDPFLQIYKGETLLRENDDWDAPLSAQPALRDAATSAGAFPLQVRRDAAMIITLQPGSYTAKMSGFQGATGVGLIEIYELN